MRCGNCGTDAVNGAEFCHKCGSKFSHAGMQPSKGRSGATQASFLGGQPTPHTQHGSYPGTATHPRVQSNGMPPQMPPMQTVQYGAVPPTIWSNGQSSYPGTMQTMHYGQQTGYIPAAHPTQTRVHSAEERLRIAKQQAKLRERYQNPGVAAVAIIFGFLAVLLVALALAAEYFHYAGMAVGLLACVAAVISRRRGSSLAWFGLLLGMLAILGGAAIIVLDVMAIPFRLQ